jgi:hypothetical protein
VGLQLYYDHNDPSAASKHLPGSQTSDCDTHCSHIAHTREVACAASKKKKKTYPQSGGFFLSHFRTPCKVVSVSRFLCKVGVLSLQDGCQGRTGRELRESDALLGHDTHCTRLLLQALQGHLPPLQQLVQILYLYTR